MAAIATPFYKGHESFLAICPAAGTFPVPSATTVAAFAGSLAMAGYTDVPQFNQSEGLKQIKAAGAYIPVGTIGGPRIQSFRGNTFLTAYTSDENNLGQSLLELALRSSTLNDTYPMHLGLPLIDIGVGAVNDFESGHGYTQVGRYCMINTASLQFQEGQEARVAIEAWPLCVQDGSTVAAADIGQNFGETMAWYSMALNFDGADQTHILSSSGISVNNNLLRSGVRGLYPSASFLNRCPRDIKPGTQDITIQLSTRAKIPTAFMGMNKGSLVMTAAGATADGAVGTYTITAENCYFSENNQTNSSVEGEFSYSSPVMASQLTVTYAVA